MSTAEHLTSLDATLAAARAAWEEEKKLLSDRIFVLETELALHKGLLQDAVKARSNAENFGTRLLTQFAVVEHVFAEARQFALSAGANIEGAAAEAVDRAKSLIDAKTASAIAPSEVPHVQT